MQNILAYLHRIREIQNETASTLELFSRITDDIVMFCNRYDVGGLDEWKDLVRRLNYIRDHYQRL